jgi:hypothetical protein
VAVCAGIADISTATGIARRAVTSTIFVVAVTATNARALLRATLTATKTLTTGIVHIWRIVAITATRTSVNGLAVTATTVAHFSATAIAVTGFRALTLLWAGAVTRFLIGFPGRTSAVTAVSVICPLLYYICPSRVGRACRV